MHKFIKSTVAGTFAAIAIVGVAAAEQPAAFDHGSHSAAALNAQISALTVSTNAKLEANVMQKAATLTATRSIRPQPLVRFAQPELRTPATLVSLQSTAPVLR